MGFTGRMAATAALLALPAAAGGQAGRCEGGRGGTVIDLGYDNLGCSHCQIEYSPGYRHFRFWTEPRLEGIHGEGAGRLQERDVLVAVDGLLITTDEAGQRMAAIRDGQRVRLTVRRGGATREVQVVAHERC